jgi:alpha-galactosidase
MVKSIADSIVEQGLDKLGYKYVCLDDCWSATTRNSTGHLQPESDKFPSGMKSLANYVHDKNLSLGLYTCVGTETCKGHRPGSFEHYELDAQTLADWGVDLIKMDHCGNKGNYTDQQLYGSMSAALNKTGRPIVFSMCQWGLADVWEWGAEVAQMYRIQMDHLPFWSIPTKGSGAGYSEGTKNIIEWMAHLQPSKWTKKAGWLDPDFLMTLYEPTMDFTASRTEYTFWAVWSAPLLVSTDLRKLSDEKKVGTVHHIRNLPPLHTCCPLSLHSFHRVSS